MRFAAVSAALIVILSAALMPLAATPAQAAPADWTFLVYLGADNDLEPVGILDFLEMAAVGSSPQVNLVVQFDRAVGFDASFGDWTTTKRFRVTQGMTPTAASALVDLGEVDMAAPAALVDFVTWGVATYPARHYFLDLWDHGFGWPGILQDGTGYLSTSDLGTALGQVRAALGRNLDIVGNDACRMTLEIMYELQPYVDYFVGSQKDEPVDGWPYDAFLGPVLANPSMSPIDVGDALVSAYIASYEGTSPYSVTLSLVSSAALPGLVRRLAEFTAELNASVPLLKSEVLVAHTATERYEGNEEVDLYHFTENVVASVGQTRLQRLAEGLQDAIRSAVIANEVWDNPNPENGIHARNAHGLSIWFPSTLSDPAYASLALSRDTDWDGFLASYRGGTPVRVPVAADAVSIDTDAPPDGLLDRIVVSVTVPQNGTLGIDLYVGATYVESRDVRLTAGEAAEISFGPTGFGIYSVALLYYVGGKLADIVTRADLVIQSLYRFEGTVVDLGGVPLVGAVVTVTNPRTELSQTATTTASGYVIAIVLPGFAIDGDSLVLSAAYAGRRVSVTFTPNLTGTSYTADLLLDLSANPADTTLTIALVVALAIAAALLAVVAVWQWRVVAGRRERP